MAKRIGRRKAGRKKTVMSNITLNEYFTEWITHKERTAIKSATAFRYRQVYDNHFREGIGTKKIRAIRREDVKQMQADLLEEVSEGTDNYLMRFLKQILDDALTDEIIAENPAERIKLIKKGGTAASETYHRALTEEETAAFLKAAKGDYYYEIFALLLLTGLRQGEGSALHWEDVDWEENVLHIRRTLTFDQDGHVITGPPKSPAGERDIPMNENIRRILHLQKEKVENRWGESAITGGQIVFPSKRGKLLSNTSLNKAISRILEKLRREGRHIDHFSSHAFRDTFATRFIEQGGKPHTLKTILGHSSLAMTMDIYAHVLPSTKQKEMDMVKIVV